MSNTTDPNKETLPESEERLAGLEKEKSDIVAAHHRGFKDAATRSRLLSEMEALETEVIRKKESVANNYQSIDG